MFFLNQGFEEIYKTFFHQHHGRKSTGLDSYRSRFDIRSNYLFISNQVFGQFIFFEFLKWEKGKEVSIYFLVNLILFKLNCFFLNIKSDILHTNILVKLRSMSSLRKIIRKIVCIGDYVVLISNSLLEASSCHARIIDSLKFTFGHSHTAFLH